MLSRITSNFKDSIMIALSSRMAKYFINLWFTWKYYIIPNWINTKKFKKIDNPQKDIIYLWNINKNKGQELFLQYYSLKYKIDFVWPYLDKTIKLTPHNYLGIWSKEEVYNNLWNYKVLVLLSKSEWDPLVVKEALAAWCSLLVSKSAWINLEETEFIKKIDINNKDELKNINFYLEKLIKENKKLRPKIFKYAKNFD